MSRQKPVIRLFYSCNHKLQNLGDELGPIICRMLSGAEIRFAKRYRCQMVSIGSILQVFPNKFWFPKVHVWGSGFMSDCQPHETKHTIHAVRGKETARRLTNCGSPALGDPGLLVDRLIPNHASVPKKYAVGLIPHFVERSEPILAEWSQKRSDVTVLDICDEAHLFMSRLAECEMVISSSLHGLILADSLGIPNAWMELSDNVQGQGFKFRDYYSVFDIPCPQPLQLDNVDDDTLRRIAGEYDRPGLEQIKQSLVESFPFCLVP